METPIRIIGSAVPRDIYVGYAMRLFRAKRQTQYLAAAAVILVPALLFGVHDFLTNHAPFPAISCLGTAALAYAFFGIPIRYRSTLGKTYDKAATGSLKTDFQLTPTHLLADTNLVYSESKWAAVTGAVEYQGWLILHFRSRTLAMLDTQKIESPATVADVQVLLTQQNIPFGMEKIVRLESLNK